MTVKQYTVRNRFDVIEFEGTLIGSASTRKHDRQDRWTEIHIYRTTTDKYVVQRLGCSVRYHLPEEKCSSGKTITGVELTDEMIPCPQCEPETQADEDFSLDLEFQREVTHSSADVVTEPEDIRKSLTIINKVTGNEFLSSVAYTALQEAVRHDRSLLGVFDRKINL